MPLSYYSQYYPGEHGSSITRRSLISVSLSDNVSTITKNNTYASATLPLNMNIEHEATADIQETSLHRMKMSISGSISEIEA